MSEDQCSTFFRQVSAEDQMVNGVADAVVGVGGVDEVSPRWTFRCMN